MIARTKNDACCACGNTKLAPILDLPRFPLTGIYINDQSDAEYPFVDQGFALCPDCGHGQLLFTVDPDYLYGSTYTHRGSSSPIATGGNDFFIGFLESLTPGQTFKQIVEVGCNDLYMLSRLTRKAGRLVGIDPIWKGRQPELPERTTVVGEFLENIDLSHVLGGKPDLIISAHCFEHVSDPKTQLSGLIGVAANDALFVVEVPSLDTLLTTCRFDQVFHQHIQYFSLASFLRMVEEIGGQYVAHTFNYGYWGGTMLVAFRKRSGGPAGPAVNESRPQAPGEAYARSRYAMFREQLDSLMDMIQPQPDCPVYGFGAAQMLPALAYHMKTDFSFLESILDDNPERTDKRYPHMPVWIRKPTPDMSFESSWVLITALDSLRPIMQRLLTLKPRRILVPLSAL